MRRLIYSSVVVCIGVFLSITSIAQENIINFERITTDNGLSKNNVFNITQDSIGFLWFGTDYGLNRYDGYEFKHYLNNISDTSIISNYISATLVSSDRTLWVVTNEYLQKFDYETDSFKHFQITPKTKNTQGFQLATIIELDTNNLLIGSIIFGLYKFNIKTEVFTNLSDQINNIGVSSFMKDSDGTVWIGGDLGKLFHYNVKNNTFREFTLPLKNKNTHDIFINFISKQDNNELLLGTVTGLFTFNKETKVFLVKNIRDIHTTYSYKCYFKDDSLDVAWFGTESNGVVVSNVHRSLLLERKPHNLNSLSNNEVQCIHKDNSGVYWVATMGGINKFDPRRTFFIHYQNDPLDKNSLTSNNISSFCEDKNHNIWIGIMGTGINIFNPKTRKITPLNKYVSYVPAKLSQTIFDLKADNFGYIWIATNNSLFRYNQKTKHFKEYDYHYYNPSYMKSDNLDQLDGRAILSISKGINGDIWLGLYGGGVSRIKIDPLTNKLEFSNFLHIKNNSNSLSSNYIRKVFIDRFGIVWIGTLGGGLDMYDPQTRVFTNFKHKKGVSSSLSNNFVTEIYEDHYGNLWIGTYRGLNKFNREKQIFTQVTDKNEKQYLMISELFLDKSSNLWITTDNGLYKYNLKKKSVRKFGVLNGLQGNNFNINALFISSEGIVYIGGRNGFNTFNPSKYHSNNFMPTPIITGIAVDDKKMRIGYKGKQAVIIDEKGKISNTINLTYENKIISINYSALSYSLNKQNSFAYKLEGLDDEWIYTNANKRIAMFTNLKPGKYTFKVKASNNDGVWNEAAANLNIVMAVPYWKTWWAIFLYVAFITGIILAIMKFIIIKKRLEQELLVERLDRERIMEINKMKIEFFSNISHEFRTPLTLILSPVDSLLKSISEPKIKSKLELIKSNATRLLNLVNQLLDFRKSETDKWELNAEQLDIIEFIEEVKMSFNELASKKNITFELKIEEPRPLIIWFDRMKMKSVFYNLLSNAFKYTPDEKKVTIVIRKETISDDSKHLFARKSKVSGNEFIVVDIIDEGKGIAKDKLPYIFDRFYTIDSESLSTTSTGIGLTLVKKITTIHHGLITVDSTKGKGSIFSVYIPSDDTNKNDNIHDEEDENIEDIPNITEPEDPEYDEFEETKINDSKSPLVLIVEDDDDIRNYIIDELSSNFTFKEATNGDEGLAIAKEIVPDIIISDVIMPKMHGTEMCTKLKKDISTNHIPVILLTAKSSDEDMLEGLKTGADSYLTKPFNIDLLKVKIDNILLSREKLKDKYSGELFLKPKDVVIEDVDGELLAKLIEIIEDNMSDPDFSVKTLSNKIGLSRMQLYRKLKAIVDKTPHELINTIRMERAAQVLLQKQLTIAEVAYSVGFNTPKYFSRCFKDHYGMLPTEYIKTKSENT